MEHTPLEVAQYVIEYYISRNQAISNTRLQCLLFLIQGESFAKKNSPVMDAYFEIKHFYPCIRTVEEAYKKRNFESVGVSTFKLKHTVVNKIIVDSAMNVYGNRSTPELLDIIHQMLNIPPTLENNHFHIISDSLFRKNFPYKGKVDFSIPVS